MKYKFERLNYFDVDERIVQKLENTIEFQLEAGQNSSWDMNFEYNHMY